MIWLIWKVWSLSDWACNVPAAQRFDCLSNIRQNKHFHSPKLNFSMEYFVEHVFLWQFQKLEDDTVRELSNNFWFLFIARWCFLMFQFLQVLVATGIASDDSHPYLFHATPRLRHPKGKINDYAFVEIYGKFELNCHFNLLRFLLEHIHHVVEYFSKSYKVINERSANSMYGLLN